MSPYNYFDLEIHDVEDSHGGIVKFNRKPVRRVLYYGEWWFVINDVVAALTGSDSPAQYVKQLHQHSKAIDRLFLEGEKGIATPQLLRIGTRRLGCWNAEALFRLTELVELPKVEAFRRWLARSGYEQIKRSEDPEVALKKAKALYRARGYSAAWIARRLKGMAIREELVNEWASHGVKGSGVYRSLTNEIAQQTFGMAPAEHRRLKKLAHQSLRDHMTEVEQLFSMLGEASTIEIVRTEKTYGYMSNYLAAKRGGRIAGMARRRLEKETGQPVVSRRNYLPLRVKKEQLELLRA